MASHKTILVEENVFAKLQALQKNSNYFMAHGVQHQLGASIDLSVIATALIRLALNNQSLCDAAVTEALETIRKQLAKISSSPTTTHREQ